MKLSSRRLNLISSLLEKEVENGNIPGAVVAVGHAQDELYLESFGYAENQNGIVRKMTTDTIFDLASLTKIMATLPSVLSLIDNGVIRLNDPVALFIPEFADVSKGIVTIRHLLTHTAGLAPYRLYYKLFSNRSEMLQAIRYEGLHAAPGIRTEYSDIGFMLLGEIVSAVSQKSLSEFATDQVFSPLGMTQTMFCPPESIFGRIAATEHAKVGTVHDENAEALGGVSGHAGLFAPMSDIISYISMWLGYKTLLSESIRRVSIQNQTPDLNGKRGLGWVCRNDPYDHMGDLWPDTAVGHTGFTGTSIAFDSASGLWMIILTNDVHYGREKKSIIRLRGRLHNIVGSAIESE